MPNAIAYAALAAWPVVAFVLFRLMSRPSALVWTIVGGYLLLPFAVGIDLPALPTIDKTLVPALAAAVLCFTSATGPEKWRHHPREQPPIAPRATTLAKSNRGRPAEMPRDEAHRPLRLATNSLLLLMIVTPFITVLQNPEPVPKLGLPLPGLTLYDGASMALSALMSVVPFMLAQRFLKGDKEHVLLLSVLCLAGLLYTFPALLEVRLSPQLSRWVYGFLAQSFAQAVRDGGFRPVVFLQHGLWLAIFLAMAVLAAVALWRQHGHRGSWLAAAIWLLGTLALCRSLGGLTIALALLPAIAFLPARGQIILAAGVAAIFVVYPVLRGAHLVPVRELAEWAEGISADRAQSLIFRFDNEDILLARAGEKPLAGWGGWGRSRVFDAETGQDISITDGIWVITIGASGWLGYLAQFGLLTTPVLLLSLRPKTQLSFSTAGLCLVLAANLVDMIPNATLTPLTWLVAGALMGRASASNPAIPASIGGSRKLHPLKNTTRMPLVESRRR